MRTDLTVPVAHLSQQQGHGYEVATSVPAPDAVGVALIGIPEDDPIELELQLSALDEGVLVQGTISATAVGQCARCLQEITLPMQEQIAELVFHPERQQELIAEGDEEAADLPVVADDVVDLEPLVRDALVLSLPLSPLCRPDCPGLCAECGERWDDLPDDHKHEFLDPRFSALDALAEQLMAGEAKAEDEAGEPSA
ncbi:MAG: DUF177 domain-containing protein [Trueperella sp.]|nr:DUF177 domain-containing protein [Trueperella sp.]